MQVRFKIQSCSSHCASTPASNLLSKYGTWQSQRFCDYPQQLTVSFFQPVLVKKIKIVSHAFKAPTRVNILYHLSQHKDIGFQRYGYLTFSEPKDNVSSSEIKEVEDVNVRANEMRFIFVSCYHTKGNFFSQVGLSGLQFTGEPIDHVMPSAQFAKTKGFQAQTTLLMQLKQSFIKREQFEEAKQIKQMQSILHLANEQVVELQKEKQKCVSEQDFLGAKKIKEDLIKLRQKVSDIAKKFYDPQGHIRMIKSDVALKQKIEEMNLTPRSNSFKLKQSRKKTNEDLIEPLGDVGEVTSEDEDGPFQEVSQSRISHDDKILPAIINKMKGPTTTEPIVEASQMADNQFYDGENKSLPPEPEPVGPADEANSSVLLEFFQPMFVRKLHSRFWQFRLEAITQAYDELKASQNPAFLTKTRLRSYLFIYLKSLQSNSYKTTSTVLDMMDALAQTKVNQNYHKELHNELEAAVKITLKIVGDSNQKIRTHAEKTMLRMMESPVFGVFACYSGIIKAYSEKGLTRLKRNKLENLAHLVQKYGVGENAVPHSIADFSMKAASDPEAEVRKAAIELAKVVKAKGGKHKIDSYLADSRIKSSVAKQLQG